MSAKTCDYAGNGGYLEGATSFAITDAKKRGAIPLLATGRTNSRVKLADIRDGQSNTFLLWESAGAQWYSHQNGKLVEQTWDQWHQMYGEVSLILSENDDVKIRCTSRNSIGYLYAWAGVNRCRARVWDEQGLTWGSYLQQPTTFHRTVNVTNSYRAPFSFHPTICVVALADGSIRTIEEGVAPGVFVAQTSRWGGESETLP